MEEVEVEEVMEEESDDPMCLGLGSLTVRSLANTQVYTASIFSNVTS